MNNVLVLVCITLLFLVSSAQKQPKTAYEISVGNLTANLDAWDVDVAVMFYAPWCKYCKQLLPTWESIAQLAKPNKNLVVTTFDCEADDNVETCQLLKVDRYPTIAFLGYGDLHQAPKSGNVFGKNLLPRVAKFTADLYPEAIYDWVLYQGFVSGMQRKWASFVGFVTGRDPSAGKIDGLRAKLAKTERRLKQYAGEVQKYKAIEIFDSLEDHGDPFPLLHDNEPDARNLPLRVCVAEMAGEYCRHFPEEPFCDIAAACAKQDMAPKACRPAVCPLEGERGRKVVSVCMQKSVLEEYRDALKEAEAPAKGKTAKKA